jgi:hypothetical protein
MRALDAAVQIRSLRAQLDVLEARLRAVREPQCHTLADLRGMLQRDTQTTAEEIDAVKYRGRQEPPA